MNFFSLSSIPSSRLHFSSLLCLQIHWYEGQSTVSNSTRFHLPSPTTSTIPLPDPFPVHLPTPLSKVMNIKSGGWCGGGWAFNLSKSIGFCMFSDTAERALRHLHVRSINGKCTPGTFAHVEKNGSATATRGQSGILIKMAFVSVGVGGFSGISEHAKSLCKRLQNNLFWPSRVSLPGSSHQNPGNAINAQFLSKKCVKSLKINENQEKIHANTYCKRL